MGWGAYGGSSVISIDCVRPAGKRPGEGEESK